MALNKSKHWDPCAIHALVYSLCFYFYGPLFWGITFGTHFATDFLTSRLTSSLWFIDLEEPLLSKENQRDFGGNEVQVFELARVYMKKRHWFFVAIGLDQLIHFVTLALTFHYIFP